MKKVLIITLRADIGGGPKHIYDLLSKNSSIDFYIASPNTGKFSELFVEKTSDNIRLPFRKFSFLQFLKLIFFLKRHKITIVHSHGRGAGLYSRLLKLFGYKVIHTFHGIHIEEGGVGKIKLLMDKLLIPLTDKFICVSESEKRSAIDQGVTRESRTIVIPNGVEFYGKKKKEVTNKILIGTLARYNHQKGLDILISYFDKFLKNNNYILEVHIAGDGEDFEKVKADVVDRGLSNKIKLIGSTNKPIEFLNTLDVYISFARFEGLPIAVLEAMSCGIPCLLSDVVGNKDIVDHGKNGLLFDLNNYKSFESEFKKILDDSVRSNFIKPSLETIKKKFSLDKMCNDTYEVYN